MGLILSYKVIFYFLTLIFFSTHLIAQNTLSGSVTDNQGLPLPGATIIVKGTNKGTTSDFDGNFSLQTNEDDVLVISFVGFANQEVQVGQQENISISLEPDNQLEEVVVTTGYATQEREI